MFEFLKTIICPYCYNRFSKTKIKWRCNSSKCKRPENLELDEPYAEYHNITNESQKKMPHIVANPKPDRENFVKCDKCNDYTSIMICPVCHSILPKSNDNVIISVVGAPGAGKSYYVGALLKQLYANLITFDCAIQFTTEEASQMYKSRYEENFEKNLPLRKTVPPAENVNIVGANLPILCDLTDRKNYKRTFTFFDAAGENFENESIMRYVAPYISHSSAIILLLDPTKIAHVKNILDTENPQKAKQKNSSSGDKSISYDEILDNTIKVIHNHTKTSGVIKIPLAVGFSKWDLIENSETLRPEESCILKPSPHFMQGFSQIDSDNVSNEIEALLAAWGCSNFVALVKKNFKTVRFFGFSAIGADVNANGSVPNIVSKRVEDPFLWLLNEQKIIVR